MLQFNFFNSINEIDAQEWNRLSGTDYPFLRYEYLSALENSGSATPETGWQACHMVAFDSEQNDKKAIAILPLYIKRHSYGEYVFDWAWAEAYQRYGLQYYPKLLSAIPFTPCIGPRLQIDPQLTEQESSRLSRQILGALQELAMKHNLSGWHGLFLSEASHTHMSIPGTTQRTGMQYHWFNRNYHDFDDFLATFSSRKRKNLRKERQKISQQGITHRFVKGPELTDQQLDRFYDFYQVTYLKRGRQGYLTRTFFQLLRDTMPEQLMICFAEDQQQPVAGALCFIGKETLYGRYWGALADYDSLHFETCYYQGIDYCIQEQLERFDPGAQGEHKVQRGFEPIETHSLHWLKEPGFREPIEQFCREEAQLVQQDKAYLEARLPFRKA